MTDLGDLIAGPHAGWPSSQAKLSGPQPSPCVDSLRVATAPRQRHSRVVGTEIVWPEKPERFTFWLFTENVCQRRSNACRTRHRACADKATRPFCQDVVPKPRWSGGDR